MNEQLKLANKIVDVVDRANRLICVTLLRYSEDNQEGSYLQVSLFARKKEDERFQQNFYVSYKLEEYIHLLDVINSIYNKFLANTPNSNVL